jgi:hypothetical protein
MRSFPRSPCSSVRFVDPLAVVQPRQKHGFDHGEDRLNRAGATPGVRRGFKFRHFETNEIARADELAHQRA